MAQANNDAYWSAVDARIEQAVTRAVEAAIKAERERNRALMAEVLGQLQRAIDDKLTRAVTQVEQVQTEIRKLNADRPDANGIVRREYFTPTPN
jgi:hypothetical protein